MTQSTSWQRSDAEHAVAERGPVVLIRLKQTPPTPEIVRWIHLLNEAVPQAHHGRLCCGQDIVALEILRNAEKYLD